MLHTYVWFGVHIRLYACVHECAMYCLAGCIVDASQERSNVRDIMSLMSCLCPLCLCSGLFKSMSVSSVVGWF